MVFIIVVLVVVLAVIVFMNQKKFGKLPAGERLIQIKKSPNYKNNQFQNLEHTPALTEGVSYWEVMKEFFFQKKERVKPKEIIPSKKTDLLSLKPEQDVLIWFGHSSYFMQTDGIKILVDPVLSGAASPVSFTTKSFEGTDIYSVDDIPAIDYLFLSHDHWDHLDYETIMGLKNKIGIIICPLGVAQHLEHWGFNAKMIIEKDWNEAFELANGFKAYTTPARHFSGRGFARNQALWASYVLQTPSKKIFIGGDSGYGAHFAEIGKQFAPLDWAILECGQYDKSWRYIHMMPHEVLQAAKDLQAKKILPVHSVKFALANHAWDASLTELCKLNETEQLNILTPLIGEQVNLNEEHQSFTQWWKGIQ